MRAVDHRKSLIKSVRMERSLEDALEEVARERGISVNSLISSGLFRYLEWDNQTETFGYVCVPREMFKEILYADSKEVEALGKALGPELLKDNLQFWFKRPSMGNFVRFIDLISKYSGLARCKVESEGDEYVMSYRHQLGEKWSRFVSAYYCEGLRKILDVNPTADVGVNQVIIKWKA